MLLIKKLDQDESGEVNYGEFLSLVTEKIKECQSDFDINETFIKMSGSAEKNSVNAK